MHVGLNKLVALYFVCMCLLVLVVMMVMIMVVIVAVYMYVCMLMLMFVLMFMLVVMLVLMLMLMLVFMLVFVLKDLFFIIAHFLTPNLRSLRSFPCRPCLFRPDRSLRTWRIHVPLCALPHLP